MGEWVGGGGGGHAKRFLYACCKVDIGSKGDYIEWTATRAGCFVKYEGPGAGLTWAARGLHVGF